MLVMVLLTGCVAGVVDAEPPPVGEASTITTAAVPPSTSTVGVSSSTSTTHLPGTTTTATSTTATLDVGDAGDRMQGDIAALAGLGVREAGSDEEAAASDYLEAVLTDLGVTVDVRPVPLPVGQSSENLVVSFGSGELHVLLGAHYDSKPPSPGADDNGSGTVVLLELARRLALGIPSGPRVTIAFFGAEEFLLGGGGDDHHFGSRLLAAEMEEAGNLPDLMVSADMIGVGDRIVAATYLDTDPAAALLLQDAASRLGVSVTIERRGDISDHEAFARAGVPAAFFWRPDNPDYHLATDTAVRTDALLEDLAILQEFLQLLGGG